ncbi:MAG: endolytic transglycosylase MltG [Fimbriimonadaceae bacterium]|nr:endolytic transglycosylase MltG [Fimbriimonadaceae bacterium]
MIPPEPPPEPAPAETLPGANSSAVAEPSAGPARSRRPHGCLLVAAGLAVVVAAAAWWVTDQLRPMPIGPPVTLSLPRASLSSTLRTLQSRGIIRNATVTGWSYRLFGQSRIIRSGRYRLSPGMSAHQVEQALRQPLRNWVRLPETNWAARNANLLQRAGVCLATEYLAEVRNPAKYQREVNFRLPAQSLEGYLYPDTYDFPPGYGAAAVVRTQLKTFERKVGQAFTDVPDLDRMVTIASLVQLEVARDEERPVVAGVIENRLARGMRLQIDASINYGLQVWRPLRRSEYRTVDSPYNLYRVEGLPPTPICSPSLASIRAAHRPARHSYLYYVAMPDGETKFASNLDDHEANFRERKRRLAEADRP